MGDQIPMLATAARLAFVTAALALLATSVDAEAIDRRCANFKDKVRCHCWLSNGAEIKKTVDGKGARVYAISEESMEQIIACMRRMGRPNG
jgi:hypothetical protein